MAGEDILRCPVCGGGMTREGNSLFCPKRHCFDIARSGYVTLTRASGTSGDDRDMVRSRTSFLDGGSYERFSDVINSTVSRALETVKNAVVIDAGCGEGYYSDRLAVSLRASGRTVDVIGFDLSKHACDHAAKRAKKSGSGASFAVSSVFEMPVVDRCADAVISLFAPIAENEFARVLRPGGCLIVGAAGRRHLYELKRAVYAEAYENDGRRDLPEGFEEVSVEELSYSFNCGSEALRALFLMTPYAFRTSKEDMSKLDAIDSLDVTADFDIFVYRKK